MPDISAASSGAAALVPAPMPKAAGRTRIVRLTGLWALALLLAVSLFASLAVGARGMDLNTVINAFTHFNPANTDHLVVHDLRLPRTLAGIVVGMALAIAGALMQAVTRNPLAEPGLLGVSSGASLAVVLGIWILGIKSLSSLLWFAFVGAGIVSVLVYFLGSVGRGGATPVRLALAGAAFNALLLSLVSAILLTNQETLDTYRFWVVGSLAGVKDNALVDVLPFLVAGIGIAAWAASSLNAVALGDDIARALGAKLTQTRIASVAAITLLAGTAVAIAGPIGFVGLVVPHAARLLCGSDQRWTLLYSALLGPVVLLISDIVGRIVLPPGEVQVGIMTALLGGPMFVIIVRRLRLAQP